MREHRGVKWLTAFVLAVCITGVPGAALADAYDAAMAQAAVAKEKALDSGNPADWEAALEGFLDAAAIRPTKEAAYEIGTAATKVMADDLAVQWFEEGLALGLDGPAADKAREFVAGHVTKMARLDVRGAAGGAVFVNKRRRGTLPLAKPIVVFAGKVSLRVTQGASTLDRELTLSEGELRHVELDEPKVTPPPPPPPSKPSPPPPEIPSNALRWTLIAGGASLAVASGVLLVVSIRTVNERRESLGEACKTYRSDDPDLCAVAWDAQTREWAQEDSNLIKTFRPLRTVSAIGLGVGLVAVGVGLFAPWPNARVTPAVTRDSASVSLAVRF